MRNIVLHSQDIRTGEEKLLTVIDNEITIGQSPSVSAVLDDFHCSGIHALIERDSRTDTYRLVDLGSRFGTYRNGRRISECSLRMNDSFVIGSKKLTITEAGLKARPAGEEGLSEDSLLKIFDSITSEEKLLVTEKNLLQVEMHWGERLLELRTFNPGSVITLGSGKEAT
ncbi:MAG: FHA domain-containing protein, partial [Oligoflexia bacterium]|nr:FHA domain-containing protein [Oligoflexia bacterium]